jgi:ABC-2 type transport system ATP-binding protein/lipopolysaccharide transport system ATP-binding protein
MHDFVIKLDHVFVRYRLLQERVTSFKEYTLRKLRGKNTYATLWALRDVSLDIHVGEVVGVVGANGSGKSTMLKVIGRVLAPTAGRVRVRGDVAPILSIGTGFDPEMTGRENIYLNGAMLGFTRREMRQKLGSIVEFTGLDEFIEAPLRTFSAGMRARLAFAIATDVNADLLLLDEILAVGDKDFHQRCLQRMTKYKQDGRTIVIVSHDLETLQALCSRIVWIEHGQVHADGTAADLIPMYKQEAAKPLVDEAQVQID